MVEAVRPAPRGARAPGCPQVSLLLGRVPEKGGSQCRGPETQPTLTTYLRGHCYRPSARALKISPSDSFILLDAG